MESSSSISLAIAACVIAVLVPAAWSFIVANWLRPLRLRRIFEAQGIRCLPYHFFYGNLREIISMANQARSISMPCVSHNILPRAAPQYYHWSKEYGSLFVNWLGPLPRLNIADPELVKVILSNKAGHFSKPQIRPDAKDLLSKGLVALEGEKWAAHRRILNPSFHMEKLKAMVPTIAACVSSMVDKWKSQLAESGKSCKEIEMQDEMRKLSADVIAHTAFGTSYSQGKRVFELQQEQQILVDKVLRSIYIPGFRFLPTSINRYRWRLEKEIRKHLRTIIQSRHDHRDDYASDLLGLMMAANKKEDQGNTRNLKMNIEDIVDECKLFFFAGHETTSNLLTWTIMLLSHHTEWQERARAEIFAVCGKNTPDAHMLSQLKIVGSVLNEALRLYGPVNAVFRWTTKDMKLSNILIPRGTSLMLHFVALHHNPDLWGPDVHEFNPERFIGGVANACKHPAAFLPFSMGPRICIGQNFALLEAKMVLSMLLQHLKFHLSPAYVHAPTILLTLKPQYGLQIMVEEAEPV